MSALLVAHRKIAIGEIFQKPVPGEFEPDLDARLAVFLPTLDNAQRAATPERPRTGERRPR